MDKYKKNKQEKDDSQSHNKNKLSSICISNMSILVCKVVEKSLMKNVILPSMDEKKIGQIQGRISRRRLVPNITIQQVIINLLVLGKSLTKYFIPQSIKGKKIGQIEGRISRRRLVPNPTI